MRFHVDSAGVHAVALTAALLALATCLGYVEAVLMPALPVPGLKLGLANIAVIIALVTVGPWRAALVSLGRVLLVALATGVVGGPAMILALAGAVASWSVMALMSSQRETFSVVGWSLAGSCAHSVGQLVVAVLVTGTAAPIMLLPVSLSFSLVTGTTVGVVAYLLISRIPVFGPAYVSG